jgi:F-type H+-transporting ATPase subunit epsilon
MATRSADAFSLEIVTPAKSAYKGLAYEVTLPGVLGQLGILPGHLPLLTALDVGPMVVKTESGERTFFVSGGFAEVSRERITVLTEECEGVSDIDVALARQALEEAMKLVEADERAAGGSEEDELRELHRAELKRAQMRLLLSGKDHD